MIQGNFKRRVLAAAVALACAAPHALADGFVLGPINGQENWTVGETGWDDDIEDAESYSGMQSWHFSNAGTAGNPLGNSTHPQSPSPSGAFNGFAAGQPDSGANFDGFLVNFKFRPESEVNADGTEVRIRLTSPNGEFISDLAMQNVDISNDGLDLLSLQNGASNGNDLTGLFSNVSYLGPDAGWHDLTIVARFFDGADDTVEYVLNGNSSGQTTTYFEALREAGSDPYEVTDHVSFDGDRSGNSFSFLFTNTPGGFYFDDFSMSFFDVATGPGVLTTFYATDFEPGTIIPLPAAGWMGLVLLGGMAARTRRNDGGV